MARMVLVHIGNGCLHAGLWRNGRLGRLQDYSADAEGMQQFVEFVAAQSTPVCLIADLPEEDFRVETIPFLRNSERKALIQRKLEQMYAGTPFRRATHLPHPATDAHRDSMLFCALTGPEHLAPWLDALMSRQIPLIAIHSAAAVCAGLSRYFPSDHTLLLSWQKYAGLRISLFVHGHLHFSRLVPANAHIPPARILVEEAMRTRHYLYSSGLLSAGAKLDACIICHRNDRQELQRTLCGNDDDLQYEFLDLEELHERIGAGTHPADSDATALLLHLAASSPPPAHYAGPAHTRFFRLGRKRRMLYAAAALLAAGGASLGTFYAWQAHLLASETRLANEQAQHADAPLHRHATSRWPASPAEMKTVAALSSLLESASPEKMLSDISHALESCPPIRLERLSWQTSETSHTQTISLEISLEPLPANYRSMLQSIETFRAALEQQGYETQILPPANATADAAQERFSLRLSRERIA